ncbi:aromatic amino acid ammonia-lyase [Nocardiopsis coralliicola]
MAMLSLDGTPLDCARIAAAARSAEPAGLTGGALRRIAAAHRGIAAAAAAGPVYGRSTGVGANRDVQVAPSPDAGGHGRRILRSHAAAAGDTLPSPAVRAMLLVRLNQIAVGGSGVSPATARALVRMLEAGALPAVRDHGTVGTGDLAALAGTGLTLLGERPASAPWTPPGDVDGADALPLISSSALTLARTALAAADLEPLLRAGAVVTALSALAARASTAAFSADAASTSPFGGSARVGGWLRALLAGAGGVPARLQDPFAFRSAPQVQGVAVDALDELAAAAAALTATAQENPLLVGSGSAHPRAVHHGGFHMAALTLRLDAVRLAAAQTAPGVLGRLRALSDPAVTGLAPFLAEGPPGASGTMILEYTAASAAGALRAAAAPASLETAVLSRGTEDDASYAPLGARQLEASVAALRPLLAAELATALRALAQSGTAVPEPLDRACRLYRSFGGRPGDRADRDLQDDLAAAEEALPVIADILPAPSRTAAPERAGTRGR